MCGYGARGLWADMLSLMGSECDHFGCLVVNGVPLGAAELAATFGGACREVQKLLGELETKRVFSRAGDENLPDDVQEAIPDALPGRTIISRRMIRDKAKEEQDREHGKQGGNPLLKAGVNPPGKPPKPTEGLTPPVKAQKLEARGQKLEKEDLQSEESSAARERRAPKRNGHATANPENRRAVWFNRVLAFVKTQLPDERATSLLARYLDNEPAAKREWEAWSDREAAARKAAAS